MVDGRWCTARRNVHPGRSALEVRNWASYDQALVRGGDLQDALASCGRITPCDLGCDRAGGLRSRRMGSIEAWSGCSLSRSDAVDAQQVLPSRFSGGAWSARIVRALSRLRSVGMRLVYALRGRRPWARALSATASQTRKNSFSQRRKRPGTPVVQRRCGMVGVSSKATMLAGKLRNPTTQSPQLRRARRHPSARPRPRRAKGVPPMTGPSRNGAADGAYAIVTDSAGLSDRRQGVWIDHDSDYLAILGYGRSPFSRPRAQTN